jgi:predicted 2-oxoglutarate/Fe(II)-dependent dioxygenase YbiX
MNVFSKNDCEYIKSFYFKCEEINGLDVHNINNIEIRFRKGNSAKFVIINNSELNNFLLQKLNFLNIKNISSVKIIKYIEGDALAKHQDFSKYGVDVLYKTILVQLSDSSDYTGGDLIISKVTQSRDIGSVISISPTTEHEIAPITKGERYSLVLFLYESNFDIQKTLL